jgi:phosphodiesterase/alkaline phosphatase D-like protein
MSGQDNQSKTKINKTTMDRRKVLLGSTTLAATALAAAPSSQVAQAQQRPALSHGDER